MLCVLMLERKITTNMWGGDRIRVFQFHGLLDNHSKKIKMQLSGFPGSRLCNGEQCMGSVPGNAKEGNGKEEQMSRSSSSDMVSVEDSATCMGVLSSRTLIAVPCGSEGRGVYTVMLSSSWMWPHQRDSDTGWGTSP